MSKYRSRWTRSQALAVVEELEASGMSMAAFARRRGLDVAKLRRWRIRIREGSTLSTAGPRLVELVARREPTVAVGRVQIRCPSGHVVEVEGVDLATGIRAALTALEGVSGC